jgi:signal transduction histidine kinase
MNMKLAKVFVVLGAVLFVLGTCSAAVGQQMATPHEVIAKVQEASHTLAKAATAQAGEASLKQFDQKESPWVWKDSYVFVLNCSTNTIAAHPIKPDLVGKDITAIKDTKGAAFFGQLCEATKRPSGVWIEYWWPKPGEKEGSRKVSYALNAHGTPYVVSAGIYDDKITIEELEKLTPQHTMK